MKKRILSIVLVILMVGSVFFIMPTVSAQNNVVEVNADDGTDINSVIRYAEEGTTVKLFGEFTLESDIVLFSNVNLDATNAVINSTAPYAINIYQRTNAKVSGGVWNILGGAFAKISGSSDCSITNATVAGKATRLTKSNYAEDEFCKGSAMSVYNSDNTLVKNCVFKNFASDVILVNASEGNFDKCKVTIEKCSFNQTWGHSVHLYKANNCKLISNTFSKVCGDAVYCSNNKNPIISGNRISNVTVNKFIDLDPTKNYTTRSGCGVLLTYTTGAGIGKAVTSGGVTYTGNEMTSVKYYGVSMNICNNTQINKVTLKNIGDNGIHSSGSAGTVVTNCTLNNISGLAAIAYVTGVKAPAGNNQSARAVVFNNRINLCNRGIWMKKSVSSKVIGNSISNAKEVAIQFNGAESPVVSGNTVVAPVKAVKKEVNRGISTVEKCRNVKVGTSVSYGGKTYGKNTLTRAGISIYDTTTCTVLNNIVKSSQDSGVRVRFCKGTCVVKNNKLSNTAGYGVQVSNTNNAKVQNNTITNTKDIGVLVMNGNKGNVIGNKVNYSKTFGIMLNNGKNITVKSNTVNSSSDKGIFAYKASDNALIASNTVNKAKSTGIAVYESKKAKVNSNKILYCKDAGLRFRKAKSCSYKGNKIVKPEYKAIVIE